MTALRIDRVFVYGTLMRGGRLHSEMLRAGAEFLGRGSIGAALYKVRGQWYPGAVPDERSRVWGEVYLLPELVRGLKYLDEVEGVASEGSFERKTVEVQSGSRKFIAWTYFYAAPLKRSQRLPGGKFRVRTQC